MSGRTLTSSRGLSTIVTGIPYFFPRSVNLPSVLLSAIEMIQSASGQIVSITLSFPFVEILLLASFYMLTAMIGMF